MTEDFLQDLETIASADFIDWEKLCGSSFFVTGATGLIGFTLVSALLHADKKLNLGLKITALVRDRIRAEKRFDDFKDAFGKSLVFAVGTAEEMPEIDGGIDYIIHGASPTASRFFVQNPVETITTAFEGTKNALNCAKEKGVKSFVYLSSMEMYGFPQKGHKVTENDVGSFSPFDVRNSYPIGKIMCENLCRSYFEEYGVRAKIIRLTQTFGPGVNHDDNRIFAYFGRCAETKTDIVLKTKGETERSYLYTADAATAILSVLQNGADGEAYNAADESTYCSISQMAQKIADRAGICVRYDIQPAGKNGYPETLYMNLDTSKLRALGWKPEFASRYPTGGGIEEMIYRMMDWWRESRNVYMVV